MVVLAVVNETAKRSAGVQVCVSHLIDSHDWITITLYNFIGKYTATFRLYSQRKNLPNSRTYSDILVPAHTKYPYAQFL